MVRNVSATMAQLGSQVNLNSDLVKNQEIYIPSIHEQIKIDEFFKQLDETTALHQRKLEKLKALKTAYLQQLFPQSDEKMPKLFQSDMNEFKFSTPSLDEQAKIGSFLKNLDDVIALHHQKLDMLRTLRKSYLQKMFI